MTSANVPNFTSQRLVYKGDDNYDVLIGDGDAQVVIEVSCDHDSGQAGSRWRFWSLRFGNTRIGGIQTLRPSPLVDWLEANAAAAYEAAAAFSTEADHG